MGELQNPESLLPPARTFVTSTAGWDVRCERGAHSFGRRKAVDLHFPTPPLSLSHLLSSPSTLSV